jgi:sulfur-oxidizing protein SoxY
VRLNETQTVIALAWTSKGELRATSRDVRITTSGCLVRADTYASEDEMRTRVRVPERVRAGEPAEVLTLLNHPMETGLREDASGKLLPQRIINSFAAQFAGEPVIEAKLYRSLAANPYLRFFVAPRTAGELSLRWTEDTGRTAEQAAKIALA